MSNRVLSMDEPWPWDKEKLMKQNDRKQNTWSAIIVASLIIMLFIGQMYAS